MIMALSWLKRAVEDAVIIPVGLLVLAIIWPAVAFFKVVGWILYWPFADVRNRVVVVTGASSGIGQHMAYEYAKRGAVLMLAARREERLRQVAQECRKRGSPDVVICRTDVSKESDCRNLIEETLQRFGVIDVLVNNAGLAHSGLFEQYSDPSAMKSTVDVDFWGNVYTTLHALPHLKRSAGQVVVTASVAAYTTYPRQTLYNAAKGAILEFYDTLRVEVGHAVTVTIVLPGFITSEMTSGAPSAHIPWWWPMMSTQEAAKQIVAGAVMRQHYVVVPKWYIAWLPYRILAPEYVDSMQRITLLGQPPSRAAKIVMESLCGEEANHRLFEGLASTEATAKGK